MAKRQTRFDKCVSSVESRGCAYDAKAVCAAEGRKKYGEKLFEKMELAGKRKAKNPMAKRRTPAQKRATAKMLAANKARRKNPSKRKSKKKFKKMAKRLEVKVNGRLYKPAR